MNVFLKQFAIQFIKRSNSRIRLGWRNVDKLKLLISTKDEIETRAAVEGGADIIDVKDPNEGALGAALPWLIKRIREETPMTVEVSCALGDVPNLVGTVSLAALGAATTGVNYVKIGLHGPRSLEEAVRLMQNATLAIKGFDGSIKVVATGYADAQTIGSVDPLLIPEVARKADADFAMLDTFAKNGTKILAFLKDCQLRRFVEETHSYGLKAALAGSLGIQDLENVQSLGVDIVGLRGAACIGGDRLKGKISAEKVNELSAAIKKKGK
jgi:uncharacterized protein (UPF0264 family)